MALYIDFNVPQENIVRNPSLRFDIKCSTEWFKNSEVLRVIKEIDNSDYMFEDFFMNPVFGSFKSDKLSGGVKTVLLAYLNQTDGYVLPLSWLGENCYPVLGSLDIKHDVVFAGNAIPQFVDFHCKFVSRKSGRVYSNNLEYIEEFQKYVL